MRRPAVITAVAFCCTLFVVSVAVPAFGGPTTLSPTTVTKRTNSALAHARRADSRALRAYFDVWFDTPPRHAGPAIAIGVDPPN